MERTFFIHQSRDGGKKNGETVLSAPLEGKGLDITLIPTLQGENAEVERGEEEGRCFSGSVGKGEKGACTSLAEKAK